MRAKLPTSLPVADRRRHPRRPVLLAATVEAEGRVREAVCLDASAGGGYFSTRLQPRPGESVQIVLRLGGEAALQVQLTAYVVYTVAAGQLRPMGFAARWHSATCRAGREPLASFLGKTLGVCELPQLRGDTGTATYCFGTLDAPQTQFLTLDDDPAPGTSPGIGVRLQDAVTQVYSAQNPDGNVPPPPPRPTEADPLPRELAKRYTRLQLLGKGGHGVVYLAHDDRLERDVVLKFLRSDCEDSLRRYFLREVRLAARLTHPNIVPVFDLGETDQRLYYVMQYVPGRTLRAMMGTGGLRDLAQIPPILRQLAAALDHAHDHGVLHRDVKPDNVLVGDDGLVRLFDFGLARPTQVDGPRSLVVGTPWYMSPEQIRGDPIDHRADIYALGVLTYELATGRPPFDEGNVFVAHAVEPVPDPRRLRPELPDQVVPVFERALAKQPEGRPDRCRQLAEELEEALGKMASAKGAPRGVERAA